MKIKLLLSVTSGEVHKPLFFHGLTVGSSVTLVTLALARLLNLNTIEAVAFNRGIGK
jgi:hypothetical protein